MPDAAYLRPAVKMQTVHHFRGGERPDLSAAVPDRDQPVLNSLAHRFHDRDSLSVDDG